MNIEEILKRLGIEAKRTGKKWQARCPNPEHADKTPSWFIRDDPGSDVHGYHKCATCGFAGGIVRLVSTVQQVSATEARGWVRGEVIAKPVPKSVDVQVSRVPIRRPFELPAEVQFGPLEDWPKRAREYALKRMTEQQIVRWRIGYADEGRLRGRLVIPYCDAREVPRGYTARTYEDHPIRYKEPADAEGADRSIMFGEARWPKHDEGGTVVVCEGAFNALAVERAVENVYVAATAGSALRPAHAVKLSQFAHVVILTDPDRAGDKMAGQLQDALGRHCNVTRVRLAEGTDPDSISRDELTEKLRGVVREEEIEFDFGANVVAR